MPVPGAEFGVRVRYTVAETHRDEGCLPRICEFYGIVIAMFYNDHDPPHFHAIYGEHRALIRIEPPDVLQGRLPRRAWSLVTEWASQHERELSDNWQRAREHAPLQRIAPLD
ncbi:MAG: DUF4160 domain-containing protein [Dehalococcoidia bacterium]